MRQTLDSAGAVQATASYAPFGEPQGSTIAPFGFTGELQDQGLVNLRARWYDPSSGVFTGVDLWEGCPKTPYSLHSYQYGYANPVTNSDPTGRCVVSLAYWEVEGTGMHHIDVIMNDCDGPGYDTNRLCNRNPSATLTVFEGYPSKTPEPTFSNALLNCLNFDEWLVGGTGETWGTLKARSWSYSEKLAEHSNLPNAETMVEAMGNLEKAQAMGTVLTVLFNSEPCDAYRDRMNQFVQRVNGQNRRRRVVDYNLLERNSNGVAYGLLEAAGIRHPWSWQHPKYAPGYDSQVYDLVTERTLWERLW